jgi:hypothetical protein
MVYTDNIRNQMGMVRIPSNKETKVDRNRVIGKMVNNRDIVFYPIIIVFLLEEMSYYDIQRVVVNVQEVNMGPLYIIRYRTK